MKRLLNTLYVTTEGAHVRKDGQTIAVEIDGRTRMRTPVHLLGQIICFGQVTLSADCMGFAAANGVSIALLGWSGKLQARIEGPQTGNVLLRRAQHTRTETPERALPVARAVVVAKICNHRSVLRRHLRDYPDAPGHDAMQEAQKRLDHAARRALTVQDLDTVRGIEGEAGATYWQVFPYLIRNPDFPFTGRTRRPPRDSTNAVLSFLYALVGLDARAACEAHGLDPQMGFLHRDRPGRSSLALDLMEEFRAPLADRVALNLINRRQLSARDFEPQETGAVLLSDTGRRKVLDTYQDRKRTELRHKWFDEVAPLGLFPQLQAQLLARHLRGELDGYPAFVWA
ncbi:MAG: type I-C CRISPR-associated endonuclease Cas1 [Rhodobacteraceae bacterium]|nr:type I-C CRISPR-associated endonuclease Cas1 [Paracoccaceae bacterium]